MADYTKRDGQIPSRFVCIYTLFSSSYRTSKKKYTTFVTKVLAVIVITAIFDLIR